MGTWVAFYADYQNDVLAWIEAPEPPPPPSPPSATYQERGDSGNGGKRYEYYQGKSVPMTTREAAAYSKMASRLSTPPRKMYSKSPGPQSSTAEKLAAYARPFGGSER